MALAISAVTIQPPLTAQAGPDWTFVEDLEAAVLGHTCPAPATIDVLGSTPAEQSNAASILRAADAANSPLIGALFDTYHAARTGVTTSTETYELANFAQCFATELDVSRYEEQLKRAAEGIDGIDQQVQYLVDNGTATVHGSIHTVAELSEPVIALALDRVGESSQLALALMLEALTMTSMLQYTSQASPGVDLEAGARPEVNDVHVAVGDAVEPIVDSVPPVVPWPVRRCKFRQTQSGDREGSVGERVFVLTNDPPIGAEYDLYALINHRVTYLYNEDLKCMKFADMPDGDFEFEDRTPFPANLICGWRVLEPYGYRKFYEFLPGYPQSGYMMRNIYDVVYECDTVYIPIFKIPFDRDCPYNNVYAHYDNESSWFQGEPTQVCH